MNNYESMAIEKSTLLASQGDWLKAFKLLKEVANNIIDAKDIETHHNNLLNKRHLVIHNYEMMSYIAKQKTWQKRWDSMEK